MTQANRIDLDLLRSLDISLMASELPTAEAGKAPPEWIKATPKGPVTARDGRSFTFDPALWSKRTHSRHHHPVPPSYHKG